MQMTSFIFFFLIFLTWILLYLADKRIRDTKRCIRISKWILLLASYCFVIYADIRFALILLLLSISTWYFGKNSRYASAGIVIAIGALGYFKYSGFFADSFRKLLGYDAVALKIMLPLGISFYTFSAVSYLVDIKRNNIAPQGLKEIALYLSFFPKITCGPLQTPGDFFLQADRRRELNAEKFSEGIQIFMFGLFKKLVMADRVSVFVNQVYDTPMAFGSKTILLAVFGYTFQLYFDFSGYSDMAVGIAKMLGFELPRNFNLPYLAHNVTELWKRWHISLSGWLQKYLYISLGGNRKGNKRTYINLFLTMVIGGFWHGANWTYIVWGALHGFALVVHKIWMKKTGSDRRKHSSVSAAISILATYLFFTFTAVFFRADNIGEAVLILKRVFSYSKGLENYSFWFFVDLALLMIAYLFVFIRCRRAERKTPEGYYPLVDLRTYKGLVIFFMFCGLILCLAYTGGSPFIYGNY